MMKKDITHAKNISFYALIFTLFISCSHQHSFDKKNDTSVNRALSDYVNKFSEFNSDTKLFAVMITRISENNLLIQDFPKKVALANLKKSDNQSFSFGMFHNVVCFYYSEDFTSEQLVLSNIPKTIMEEGGKNEVIHLGGKEITYSNSMDEWNSLLKINYNLLTGELDFIHFKDNSSTKYHMKW